MDDENTAPASDMGLTVALALCGVLADKGVVTMTEIADRLEAMAEHPENFGEAHVTAMLRLASEIRSEAVGARRRLS